VQLVIEEFNGFKGFLRTIPIAFLFTAFNPGALANDKRGERN